MKIMVLGADGYVGWPTAMHFAAQGHEVVAIDNYYRRQITTLCDSNTLFENPDLPDRAKIFEKAFDGSIHVEIGDLTNASFTSSLIKRLQPDVIIHGAEQPSAAYSMQGQKEAGNILDNNIRVTFNVIWGVLQHAPDCHIIKIGSIGEYGNPDISIEEGWLEHDQGDESRRFLFPREGPSLYHVSKAMSSQLLLFYVKRYGLRASNLMQGIIYGLQTEQTGVSLELMPNFYYDSIFGNVVNRFMAQAVAGVPLTVYGDGDQIRCYQNLEDTLVCLTHAAQTPPEKGHLNIRNQYAESCSVNDVAQRVQNAAAGLDIFVEISQATHPFEENEEPHYEVKHMPLSNLGVDPKFMTQERLQSELAIIKSHEAAILRDKITMPLAN
jgi:UDP-sulfoquinovose synthase